MKHSNQRIFLVLIVLAAATLCHCKGTDQTPAAGEQNRGVLVIDVRQTSSFDNDHIGNAINIPFDKIATEIEKYEKNRDREILLYCTSGKMSELSKTILEGMGYTHVINGGSIDDMRLQGF